MNRQQRRATAKQGVNPFTQYQTDLAMKLAGIVEQLQSLHKQNLKITEFNRKMFGSLTKLKEALERKGVITNEDFEEVEKLYLGMLPRREAKIKEIVASEMTDEDKIKFCLDDINSRCHGYDKYNIVPVRDLNVAPGVVIEGLTTLGYEGDSLKLLALSMGVPEVMLVRKNTDVRQT
jgi:hypothetical protein